MSEIKYSDKHVEMCPRSCSNYGVNDCYLSQREAEEGFDGQITFEEVENGCSLETNIAIVSRLVGMDKRIDEARANLERYHTRIPRRRDGSWSRGDHSEAPRRRSGSWGRRD